MRSRFLRAANAQGSPRPRPGDICVGCVHKSDPHGCHYFYLANGVLFKSSTGRVGTASWMLLCDACFMEHGGHIKESLDKDLVQIGFDMVWPDHLEVTFPEKN